MFNKSAHENFYLLLFQMNKNNLISKVFQGGEGIKDLTIKNKLNVVGSVSLPADSIQQQPN